MLQFFACLFVCLLFQYSCFEIINLFRKCIHCILNQSMSRWFHSVCFFAVIDFDFPDHKLCIFIFSGFHYEGFKAQNNGQKMSGNQFLNILWWFEQKSVNQNRALDIIFIILKLLFGNVCFWWDFIVVFWSSVCLIWAQLTLDGDWGNSDGEWINKYFHGSYFTVIIFDFFPTKCFLSFTSISIIDLA